MTREIRFGVVSETVLDGPAWLDFARRVEDAGVDVLLLRDHFSAGAFGQQLAPFSALAAAAAVTTRLGVGTMVLSNDFRHPAVVAHEAASLHLSSGGRFELGVGPAGTSPNTRRRASRSRRRAGESPGSRSRSGSSGTAGRAPGAPRRASSTRSTGWTSTCCPRPDGPRLLVGAGGPRMLRLAARHADIVGLLPAPIRDADGAEDPRDRLPAALDTKLAVLRQAAGDRFAALELNAFATFIITGRRRAEHRGTHRPARLGRDRRRARSGRCRRSSSAASPRSARTSRPGASGSACPTWSPRTTTCPRSPRSSPALHDRSAGPQPRALAYRRGGPVVDTCHDRLPAPDLADVLAARQRIAPYLRPTPLYRYPALDALTGAQVWVKHENHQPVGAFKVRGGVNLIGQLSADERRRGVIAASTGNHGQSVAYAARPVRRARGHLRARAGQPGEGRVDAGARRRGGLPRPRLRRGPRALRKAGRRARLPVLPLRGRAAAHRGRRHLHPRDPRGPARHRGDRGPGRGRQRGGGGLRGGQGGAPVDRGDRRAVRGGPGRLPLLAGPALVEDTMARSRRGWRPGPRSSCRSRSCGSCWTTSSWSPRMR